MEIILLHTGAGAAYARRIKGSVKWLSEHGYPRVSANICTIYDDYVSLAKKTGSRNTVLYVRAAYPSKSGWMKGLFELKDLGYNIVNDPESLMITSNKLECSRVLEGKVPHPRTWEIQGVDPVGKEEIPYGLFIAKPITSQGQGSLVTKLEHQSGGVSAWVLPREDFTTDPALYGTLAKFTGHLGSHFILQEFVDYVALHRVVVINGTAIPMAFEDRVEWHPTNWKVSCCLNRETMRLNPSPVREMLTMAERAQYFVGAEISFIDLFELRDGSFTMSEINSACSLRIHEDLARNAGHPHWNIHNKIARHLISKEGD